jgi:hypothetical protein
MAGANPDFGHGNLGPWPENGVHSGVAITDLIIKIADYEYQPQGSNVKAKVPDTLVFQFAYQWTAPDGTFKDCKGKPIRFIPDGVVLPQPQAESIQKDVDRFAGACQALLGCCHENPLDNAAQIKQLIADAQANGTALWATVKFEKSNYAFTDKQTKKEVKGTRQVEHIQGLDSSQAGDSGSISEGEDSGSPST